MKLTLLNQWQITIPSVDWFWLLLISGIVSVIICFGAYGKIVKVAKKSMGYFLLVSLVNIAVIILLFALVLPIEKLTSDQPHTIILTTGVTQQQVDSLKLNSADSVYFLGNTRRLQEIELSTLTKNVIQINAIENLPLVSAAVENISIYGDGLTAEQLSLLHNKSIRFYPGLVLPGLIDMEWRKEIKLGESLFVKGKYQQGSFSQQSNKAHRSSNIVEVALFDPFDKKIMSERVKNNENFSLSAHPKVLGQFTYKLKVIDSSGKIVSNESVAVSVKDDAVVNLLIKQSSPSFETRQLKNWAAEQGAMVVVQTHISKDKTITQKININSNDNVQNSINDKIFDGQKINVGFLTHFDILVIDGRNLLSLTDAEVMVLQQAIQQGLGLYVIADSSLLVALSKDDTNDEVAFAVKRLLSDFSLSPNLSPNKLSGDIPSELSTLRQDSQLFWLNNFTPLPTKVMQTKLTVHNGSVLVKGNQQQAIVASKNNALGHISISLFNSSYHLITQNNALLYSKLWQYLLSNIARNNQSGYWLPLENNSINRINEQSLLCALTAQTNNQQSEHQQAIFSAQLMLSDNVSNEHNYCGYVWPQQLGWKSFDLFNANRKLIDQQWLYSYQESDWRAWQQTLKNSASLQAAKYSVPSKTTSVTTPLDKTFIWLLLFICFTLLWLEHKNRF